MHRNEDRAILMAKFDSWPSFCLDPKEGDAKWEKLRIKNGGIMKNKISTRRQRGVIDGRRGLGEKTGTTWLVKRGVCCTRVWDSSSMINHRARTGRYRCENIIQPVGILLNPTKLWSPGLVRYSTDRGPRVFVRGAFVNTFHNAERDFSSLERVFINGISILF